MLQHGNGFQTMFSTILKVTLKHQRPKVCIIDMTGCVRLIFYLPRVSKKGKLNVSNETFIAV